MQRVRWLGAAGLECSTHEQSVLIDPYFSRVSKRQLLFGRPTPNRARIERYLQSLPAPLSAILVGHTHIDHALDVPALAQHSDCAIVGSRSLDTLMRAHGLPGRVEVCQGGERLALGKGLAVTMVASGHGRVALGRVPYPGEVPPNLQPPLRTWAYRHGAIFAIVVEMGDRTLIHLGSAYLPPNLSGPCDALFCCVSGWKRIPAFVPHLLEAVQPKVVVPFHWDDFTMPWRDDTPTRPIPFVDVEGAMESIARHAPQVQIEQPCILKSIVL